MQINMPVTNHEITIDETEFMLTKTDLKGIITYANHDFIKVSGFSEAELVGASHNIVRHPDMPVEAFEDMWRSVKEGRAWTGMVKNRTKNGDYYWVEANAAAIVENGEIQGYLSARRKPSRQQIEEAAAAYRLFKEGKAHGLSIVDGYVVKDSWLNKFKGILHNIKVGKVLMGLVSAALLVIISQAVIGLYMLNKENGSLKAVYQEHLLAAQNLSVVSNALLNIEAQFFNVAGETTDVITPDHKKSTVLNKTTVAEVTPVIEKEMATVEASWGKYAGSTLTPTEKALADKFNAAKVNFIDKGVQPALVNLKKLDAKETMSFADSMPQIYNVAKTHLDALIQMQSDEAKQTYQSAQVVYENIRLLTIVGLTLTAIILLWLGFQVVRMITKPLERSIQVFGDIANRKLNSKIDSRGDNELSQVLSSLKTLQTLLNVNMNEEKELAEKVNAQSVQFEGQLAAISKSTGVIEFSLDGKIIAVNDIFLHVLGFSRQEVIGQHHSVFVEPEYKASAEYKAFWEKLNRGEFLSGQYLRIGKGGHEIWLEASYNPILDVTGKPYKIVKYATDITEQKLKNADFEGQISAIGKSQGVIEIALDGTVLKANETYLKMLGYNEHELVGKHVSMVLDPTFAKSEAYSSLWNRLVAGGSDAGQYKRIAKGGREVWIQASYNPIYDLKGNPFKIVNYTIDITEQKLQAADNAGQISAINKIQGVIEFDLTGKVIAVNENFANVTGYTEKEIVGNHHSMFVEATYKASHEYKAFWEKLARGEADLGQYKRIGKGGKEVWLQASYNPIMDMNGKPFKVVKYATDITEQYNNAATLAHAVEETQEIIENAKSGDLSNRVSLEGKTGAIASLCDGINALMDKMTEVIVQVREAGDTINTAAGEISSGNSDLSSRTEQQASSLEETAASMEELASTVKNNAENAKQANQLAAAASGVAIKGGEVVGQVVNTMTAINQSAHKIEDIIAVIDGIAFQTNILALNAAVEAARAGEQGRGFAVVAGEVRNLAQRSASAAKEIKELITDSVNKTAEGTTQVEQAGKTMQEIVTSVQRVTDIMGEITAASVEQSSGIDQVNTAVTSMDEVTQQNAALVEQAAAAAESLVDQAAGLIDVVSAFKLSGGNSSSGSKSPSRSPVRMALSSTSKKFSFKEAENAHLKWKMRLVQFIGGQSHEDFDETAVSCDDKCDLGKWIYGSANKYSSLSEYKNLRNSHANFHKSVGEIVRCVHEHKADQAKRLLGGDFAIASKKTISDIQAMQNKTELSVKSTKTGTHDSEWEEF